MCGWGGGGGEKNVWGMGGCVGCEKNVLDGVCAWVVVCVCVGEGGGEQFVVGVHFLAFFGSFHSVRYRRWSWLLSKYSR